MALLFADENFPLPAVRRLRTLGHDVLTTADAGMAGRRIPDDIVLQWPAGSVSAPAGAAEASAVRPGFAYGLTADRVDVVLRPNVGLAADAIDVPRAWLHEFGVRDVPVAPDPRRKVPARGK